MASTRRQRAFQAAVVLGAVVSVTAAGPVYAAGPEAAKAVVNGNPAPLIAAVKAGDRAAVMKLVKQVKPSLERRLLDKANAAIIKAGDSKEVRIGLGGVSRKK